MMKPHYETDNGKLYNGDVLEVLRELPDGLVQCVITSPPYWGLRDYGIEGQLGLEETPEEYIDKGVQIFREVRRVMRDDGTLWLNMGDCYVGGGRAGKDGIQKWGGIESINQNRKYGAPSQIPNGLKPKDLVGMPWRLAFALQADGWYLRSDIIWSKPNPMPESCTDRPTKAHEYVFLMSKQSKYYYDADAVREVCYGESAEKGSFHDHTEDMKRGQRIVKKVNNPSGRNRRTVWTIPTQPFLGEYCKNCKTYFEKGWRGMSKHKEGDTESAICPICGKWDAWISHFATFPPKLVIPCIKAGTSEKGNCSACGKPWVRVVKKGELKNITHDHKTPLGSTQGSKFKNRLEGSGWTVNETKYVAGHSYENKTIGWQPSCTCEIHTNQKPIVLDPFMGSGTVAEVCERYGRAWIGIELSEDCCDMSVKRIEKEAGQLKLQL